MVKPASQTPLSTLALAEVLSEAGLPDGALSVLPGPGSTTAMALISDPRGAKVSFTGSTEVGTRVMQAAAENITRVSLELGGKSANIVFADADLEQAVAEGILREDLFYRLNVIPIQLPPLRERREDIPLLVAHFLQKFSKELGKDVRGVTPEALAVLERYRWPGNIRELENVLERAIVLGAGEILEVDSLPASVRHVGPDRRGTGVLEIRRRPRSGSDP
mgnify:CR=1 FL=1